MALRGRGQYRVDLATEEWADSADVVSLRHFVQLLNGALEEQTWPAARRGKDHDVLYLVAPEDLSSVELPGRGGQSRTVVKAYRRQDDSVKYVRHLAFERQFRRYTWYLEIVPTYFFSRDGYWVSGFAAKHLSGIKRIERHNDVRRHVETWSWIAGSTTTTHPAIVSMVGCASDRPRLDAVEPRVRSEAL